MRALHCFSFEASCRSTAADATYLGQHRKDSGCWLFECLQNNGEVDRNRMPSFGCNDADPQGRQDGESLECDCKMRLWVGRRWKLTKEFYNSR